MTDAYTPLIDYTQVRRVIARVCLANEHLSQEERIVLSSSIGGASNLPPEQIKVLLKDTSDMPDIKVLMKNLTHSSQYRQLLIDLSALVVVKSDWHDSEWKSVKEVIDSLPFDNTTCSNLNSAFSTLRTASESLHET